jgi:hypothetical protein
VRYAAIFLLFITVFACKNDKEDPGVIRVLQMSELRAGTQAMDASDPSKNEDIPADQAFSATFSSPIDTATVRSSFRIAKNTDTVKLSYTYSTDFKTVTATPAAALAYQSQYNLVLKKTLKGTDGSVFPGLTVGFKVRAGELEITSFKIDGATGNGNTPIQEVSLTPVIEVKFSAPVNVAAITTSPVVLGEPGGTVPVTIEWTTGNTILKITPGQKLDGTARHFLGIATTITGTQGEAFAGQNKFFYTTVDPTPKFPVISDDALLTLVQQQTFKYFYDFAHPASGMARERDTSGDVVTSGGSGFGLMALIVGIERNFVTRTDGVARFNKIVTFLEKADRFHGAWSHWINGNTGKVFPFSQKDNGGDLVETSFLVQGLLTVRQYLEPTDTVGNNLIRRIDKLWKEVEWSWYRKNNENVLYWHWSPNYNWDMNFAMYGYYEEQITYFLAAASPTYPIPKIVYTNGYGRNGAIVKNNTFYNIKLPLESPGPLFWVHYSYLGLDPHFSDDYANYWEQNTNATLINRAHSIANPRNYPGYSAQMWGLTSSDNQSGYNAHSPGNDLGVITPTAALSSFPYTPNESMEALKFFYYNLGDRIWGPYGFYDAFNIQEAWYANSYLAIDQGPIIVMIENHRTGLLWNLFMSAPEVQNGKTILGFH